jgi:outer membrane protein assembly factor BamB
MVLAQNQLYIGWQVWDETNNTTTAQIYVLNASTGAQRNAYPATSYASSLAAGDGILAVSVDNGLQVYDPNSGKSLWHVSVTAPTSAPVVSVRVVDGLVYAVFSTNNGGAGFGQSYIAAYKATTGQQVWKSPSFPGDALSKFTVDHNIVYFGTLTTNVQEKPFSGNVYAYDMQQNKKLWGQHVDGGVQTAPIVSNGMVYIAADKGSHFQAHIIALTAAKGEIKWQQALANGLTMSFCLSNGVIYVGNLNIRTPASAPDGIDALKADDGSKLWVDTQHGSATIIIPTA